MEELRRRVDEIVADPATAEALKPWYRVMCKRPTFNDEFLPCFNQDNVTLVDVSDSKGVERITPSGVVANGTEYAVPTPPGRPLHDRPVDLHTHASTQHRREALTVPDGPRRHRGEPLQRRRTA